MAVVRCLGASSKKEIRSFSSLAAPCAKFLNLNVRIMNSVMMFNILNKYVERCFVCLIFSTTAAGREIRSAVGFDDTAGGLQRQTGTGAGGARALVLYF